MTDRTPLIDLTGEDDEVSGEETIFVKSVQRAVDAATNFGKRATSIEHQQTAKQPPSNSSSGRQTRKGDAINLRSGTLDGRSISSRHSRDRAVRLSPRPRTVAQKAAANLPPRGTADTPIVIQSAHDSEDDCSYLLRASKLSRDPQISEQAHARPASSLKRQCESGASSQRQIRCPKRPRSGGSDASLSELPVHALPDSNPAAQSFAESRWTPVLPAREPAPQKDRRNRSELRQSSPTESPRSDHAHATLNPPADLQASKEGRSFRRLGSSQETGKTTLGPLKSLSSQSEATTPAADPLNSKEPRRKKKPHPADLQENAEAEAAKADDELQSKPPRTRSTSFLAVPQPAASAETSLAKKVERVLGQFMEELAQDNEYWTGNSLMRARLSKEPDPALQPPAREKLTSFRHLKPLNLTPAQKHDPGQLIWGIEQMADGRPVSSERLVLPRQTFTTDMQDVPNYAHYVSITNNILASNSNVLHCWPYFGDDFDNAEAANLKEQYYMDIDGREQKLLRLGQAQKLETYVESALQELGCSWSDVLRFLLEEKPEVGTNSDALEALRNRPNFCKEDFDRDDKRWVAVLATLPASSAKQLARAGVLCEIFQKMAHFPLWHVARRSNLCKLPEKEGLLHDKTVASAELTCRICMRFDCPYHGEITERPESEEREDGDDSDTSSVSVVATDLVHPPHINYRTRVAFPEVDQIQIQYDNLTVKPGRKNPTYWQTYENRAEDRGPFYPCSHPGKSCDDEDADCSCFHENIPCEKYCGCSSACVRRFQGCSCSTQRIRVGKRGPCFEDERCACRQTGRECDPDLCDDCGVCEIVDPVNRHDENILLGRCQNASIQRGVAKCTLLGDSGIHGFGLYAAEDIRPNEFVGEYKGEIITKQEAERRGAVYDHQRLSYLFSLNRDQEVDSTYFGNKMRFINHASNGKESLSPRIIMVNTVYRIALYAGRNIRKGEELLFNYGEQFPEEQLGGKRAKNSAPQVRNANLVKNFDAVEDEDELGNVRAKAVSSAGRRSKSRKPRGGARDGAGRKPRQKDGAKPATAHQTQRGESPFEDDFAGQDAGARLAAYNVADDRVSDQMDRDVASEEQDRDDDAYEDSEDGESGISNGDGENSQDSYKDSESEASGETSESIPDADEDSEEAESEASDGDGENSEDAYEDSEEADSETSGGDGEGN